MGEEEERFEEREETMLADNERARRKRAKGEGLGNETARAVKPPEKKFIYMSRRIYVCVLITDRRLLSVNTDTHTHTPSYMYTKVRGEEMEGWGGAPLNRYYHRRGIGTTSCSSDCGVSSLVHSVAREREAFLSLTYLCCVTQSREKPRPSHREREREKERRDGDWGWRVVRAAREDRYRVCFCVAFCYIRERYKRSLFATQGHTVSDTDYH